VFNEFRGFMVFNATFNNITVISWQSVCSCGSRKPEYLEKITDLTLVVIDIDCRWVYVRDGCHLLILMELFAITI
jgi:hypothetical protein